MKTVTKYEPNYVDALEYERRYAVLTKRGRIQILVEPTAKQLRKRGTKGWRLLNTVDNESPDAGPLLMGTIQRALQEMESSGDAAESDIKSLQLAKAAIG